MGVNLVPDSVAAMGAVGPHSLVPAECIERFFGTGRGSGGSDSTLLGDSGSADGRSTDSSSISDSGDSSERKGFGKHCVGK